MCIYHTDEVDACGINNANKKQTNKQKNIICMLAPKYTYSQEYCCVVAANRSFLFFLFSPSTLHICTRIVLSRFDFLLFFLN